MNIVYISLSVLSLLAMFILSNFIFREFREALGIGLLLGNRELLRQIITNSVLANPPDKIARFAKAPHLGSIEAFQEADRTAHSKARGILRIIIPIILLGSGVVGFLGLGWIGFAIPILNFVILLRAFVGSTKGTPDKSAMERAVEHVQILALILRRWWARDRQEVLVWLDGQPHLKTLWEVLESDR